MPAVNDVGMLPITLPTTLNAVTTAPLTIVPPARIYKSSRSAGLAGNVIANVGSRDAGFTISTPTPADTDALVPLVTACSPSGLIAILIHFVQIRAIIIKLVHGLIDQVSDSIPSGVPDIGISK